MDKRLIKNIFIKSGKNRIIILTVIVATIAAGIGLYFVLQKSNVSKIVSFEECVKAGYQILETAPRQCKTPDGKTFTEEKSLKCGDGICGFIERQKGICPQDCGQTQGCVEDWQCADWPSCQNGKQTRTCTDLNNCGTTINKPIEDKVCGEECQENWQCTSWSNCENGKQARTCVDSNNCGTTKNKPNENQSCEEAKSPKEINEDSPFATNDFGIPSGVAKAEKITTKEQMIRAIEQGKVPFLEDIGIKWARQHPNDFGTFGWSGIDSNHDGQGLDFSLTDALVKISQDHNIQILAGLSPLPFDTEWQTADTYVPQNKAAYSSYVKQTVERYDGDGKDDMPGLKRPIKYWQLENEPDLHNKFRKQRGNANFSSPEEYFEVLKLTYEAVKQADAESKVMLNVVGYGQNMGDTSVSYVQQLNKLGAGNYYNIFSYHIYPTTYETSILTEMLQKFKQLIGNKPIWITESGINGKLGTKEKEQAAWVVKHYVSNIAGGVKKIVWLTFKDMSPNVPETTVAKYAGLATFDSSIKKLSYYTYKKMVEILEGSDWDNIQKIQESGGIYIYKFTKNGKSIWVAWNDNSASKQITISGISSNQVQITEAVPKYDSGKDVSSYSSAFNTETKTASGGKITVTIGDKPVFVEEN